MNRPLKIILAVVALAACSWLAYTKVIKTMYLQPRAAALGKITQASNKLAEFRKNREDHARVQSELKNYVDRTLGGDLESVDHRLRTRLNRLAEAQLEIKTIASGTNGGGQAKPTPAKSDRRLTGTANRALREELDFHELEGWVSGTGTFEQVLRFVDSIEAEPWIKRIDQLKLDPRDNGERFNVTVRLTTLFLPKKTPNPQNPPLPRPSGLNRYAALMRSNPFRVPAAPAVEIAQSPEASAFPYEQWSVTGIAQNPKGLEIWLLNRQTSESRTLAVGESLQDVVLVDARGEIVEFRDGEQHFTVMVGGNLRERTPTRAGNQ